MPSSQKAILASFRPMNNRARALLGLALPVFILTLLLYAAILSPAQAPPTIRFDASRPYQSPAPAAYDPGSAKSPSGKVLGVNSRYLTLDGKPWLPVMGEFHFSRYPRSGWEEEILKMKTAGVQVIATYVIWIHHEEIENQFDWQGQRDLRAFAQLCAKHGMYLEPRIGPWDHAEVRNGGLPDWVLKQGPTRINDSIYLSHVRAWYGQIAQQLKGLLWKDGGPVLAIQLENEYSRRGPGAGEEHILELKKIAIESGLDVPLYLVTGWDNAVVPSRAVIPVYGGGYPDAPWDSSLNKLPPAEVYAFRFQSRVAANMGAMGSASANASQSRAQETLPYLTAEIGGGIEDTYHRRPVISADDIGAMFPVMLGSGVNLYGTYMFNGGENPEGKLTTLQESQATGYPNDLPVKSYDFQAPLGEYGEERASLRKMKVFQYFLNDFGSELAPMTVTAPDNQPRNPGDLSVTRAAVRSNGDAGFLFLNNYVRNYSMPARSAVQFDVHLPDGVLTIPQHPLDIPSGAYFIWPFNLSVDGIKIRYSTAQLFTRIESNEVTTLYFESVNGIPAEFAFDATSVGSIQTSSGESTKESDTICLTGLHPGVDSSIDLLSKDRKRVRIVVLTTREAENAWKVRIAGEEHLIITAQDIFFDAEAEPAKIFLQSRGAPEFRFSILPPITTTLNASLPLSRLTTSPQAVSFAATARAQTKVLQAIPTQSAGNAPAVRIGPAPDWRPDGVAQAPDNSTFKSAAKWSITVPEGAMDGLDELYLNIKYQGDVARLSSEHGLEDHSTGNILTDNFYNGRPWSVGLKRYLQQQGEYKFDLSILPLRKDAPVYFELQSHPVFSSNGQIVSLDSVSLTPQYLLVISSVGR